MSQPGSTPRVRKPGVKDFTDAKNPFSRVVSKHMTRPEECRKDKERAGAPTKNPGMLPVEQNGIERQRGEDGRYRLVPHRYGNHEWRNSKKSVSDAASPAAAAERGASWTRPGNGVLENYLNDMKRAKLSRGGTPAAPPSTFLQRMNEARFQLPADRQTPRARSHSCEPTPQESIASAGALTRARSVSQSPFGQSEAEHGDKYGFTRKRSVSGPWTRGRDDLLHHSDKNWEVCTPRTPRTPGGTRLNQANERFDDMMTFMKANNPDLRKDFKSVKAKDKCTAGLLASDQVVLHPPSERRPKLGVATPRSWCEFGQSTASSPQSQESAGFPPQLLAGSPSGSTTPATVASLPAES